MIVKNKPRISHLYIYMEGFIAVHFYTGDWTEEIFYTLDSAFLAATVEYRNRWHKQYYHNKNSH